ncbi:MAG: site-2 protease family protein, partial [Pseudomonadota bacterium]|nr:site-2 protease family protein [Pseudomonadota bacterium]
MTLTLTSILAFIVAIGVLVSVHEFGHYWVARRLGFKVVRFSVGFGRPIAKRIGRDPDRIEYVLAAIPLGGYVRLLDEREGPVPPEDVNRAF